VILGLGPAERGVAATVHVYLIGGQSNADSHAANSGLPAQYQSPLNSVPLFYGRSATTTAYTTLRPGSSNYLTTSTDPALSPYFGLDIGFGWAMNDWLSTDGSGDKVAIIKFALGGTSLSEHWKAGGTATTANDGSVYKSFQSVVASGLSALHNDPSLAGYTISLSGMLWTQGEADITSADASLYGSRLVNFVNDVRLTYGTDLPFYLSQISLNQTAYGGANATYRDQVRAGQQFAANNLDDTYLIKTDASSFSVGGDGIHFTSAGELALGQAFAQKVIATSAVPEPSAGLLLIGGGLALSFWTIRRKFC